MSDINKTHEGNRERVTGIDTTATPPSIEDTLRAELRTARSELRAANERVADLAGQIKQHGESRVIAPYEEEAIREQGRAFESCNDQQNKIVRYVRDNFPEALGTGSLSAIVIGLLDELKALRFEKAKPGFWARVFGK